MKHVGLDVGSTTVKAVVVSNGEAVWRRYERHGTRQAETVLAFLGSMESECGLTPGTDRILLTGSGASSLAPLIGGRIVQEVVAVAAAVETLHPHVRFVSEIGGEDMKTVIFTPSGNSTSRQVYMQSACSGGTGTFIEKTARKLQIDQEALRNMGHAGLTRHKISAKCGIFAETDANSLVKSGVPTEEIIASLFHAVVSQNLATLTKGNTPMPTVLLLGGPNLFFRGLQEAWRHHLSEIWAERGVAVPEHIDPIAVPEQALYYGGLGCVEIGQAEPDAPCTYTGTGDLRQWIDTGQWEQKEQTGKIGLGQTASTWKRSLGSTSARVPDGECRVPRPGEANRQTGTYVGCDFGSTTAKAVVLSEEGHVEFACYTPSKGNPIEDAKVLFRDIRQAGVGRIAGFAITGYGKDLLKDIIGADLAVVETVAHAEAATHFFPDVDVICDVGGTDVKIMILRRGAVTDFRLNSQCSSGNGAFLQGVAERYDIPLDDYAEHALKARTMPELAMGCGVFLQSDIVNQQRKGWSADEIMASLAAILPVNVWVYAGQIQNLRDVGRKFVLQGGTHRNVAVVKAQVEFIRSKVPDAEIIVHPYPGEAGAIGAALLARKHTPPDGASRFPGFGAIDSLQFRTTTSETTTCTWCGCNCSRTFIDVNAEAGPGRPWSKVPLEAGWQRVITGNSCPKGLIEDVDELRIAKKGIEEMKRANPNIADFVRQRAFTST